MNYLEFIDGDDKEFSWFDDVVWPESFWRR
jgi:hypothetical protein